MSPDASRYHRGTHGMEPSGVANFSCVTFGDISFAAHRGTQEDWANFDWVTVITGGVVGSLHQRDRWGI